MKKAKIVSLESLRQDRGFKRLKSFCSYFEKITGEKLPETTLSGYELGKMRIGERRLKLLLKVLKTTSVEEAGLRSFFKDKEKPLRNVAKHAAHKTPKRNGPNKKRTTFNRRSTGPLGPREKSPTPKPTVTRIGLAEASEYLILVGALKGVLGNKINDKKICQLIFDIAIESTK